MKGLAKQVLKKNVLFVHDQLSQIYHVLKMSCVPLLIYINIFFLVCFDYII